MAKLQLPSELHHASLSGTSHVPLPRRDLADGQQRIALLIREGRKAGQQLNAATNRSHDTGSSGATRSRTALTSITTAMEQDFTVEGKKGSLGCPFRGIGDLSEGQKAAASNKVSDPTPHHSSDPICAAMYGEVMPYPPPSNGSITQKCPIRYMDKHSPEEIANYVEKHKHEIPRSHEVCVRRYQRNEDQIRKLDAKYGNLVTMIQDLSQLHQKMLPLGNGAIEAQEEASKTSNERVENWAHNVSAVPLEDPEKTAQPDEEVFIQEERLGHFDRPLKEVRVGESPSRPWGISIPVFESLSQHGQDGRQPESPPPAPVVMPSGSGSIAKETQIPPRKCPFDHSKFMQEQKGNLHASADDKSLIDLKQAHRATGTADIGPGDHQDPPSSPMYGCQPPSPLPQPAFINLTSNPPLQPSPPQMLFTGPVFIGYPIEQAIHFMQHFQPTHAPHH